MSEATKSALFIVGAVVLLIIAYTGLPAVLM